MKRISQMPGKRHKPRYSLPGHNLAPLLLSHVGETYVLPLAITLYPEIATVKIADCWIVLLVLALNFTIITITSHLLLSLSAACPGGCRFYIFPFRCPWQPCTDYNYSGFCKTSNHLVQATTNMALMVAVYVALSFCLRFLIIRAACFA